MSVSVADVEGRIDREVARRSPPGDFPRLCDIPGGRYREEDFYALERTHVFRGSWLLACPADAVGEPGRYRTVFAAGSPLLIVRGKDGILRAFYNTCRHRGAPVVRDECGKATLLRCQYHSWSYSLDGRLTGVPDERDFAGLRREDRGLAPVACAEWAGFIFVNLDPDARPLRERLGPLATELSFLETSSLRSIEHVRYEVACNWKAAVDAASEVYHIKTIHQNTGGIMFDTDATTVSLFAGGHGRTVTRKTAEGRAAFDRRAAHYIPEIPGFYHDNAVAYTLFPNTLFSVEPTGIMTSTVWPTGVRGAVLDVYYLGLDWRDGERPRFWNSYLNIMDGVWKEDIHNLGPIQASLDSGAFDAIIPNYQERRISWYHEEIDRRIGPRELPDHLKVEQTLAPFVDSPISFEVDD